LELVKLNTNKVGKQSLEDWRKRNSYDQLWYRLRDNPEKNSSYSKSYRKCIQPDCKVSDEIKCKELPHTKKYLIIYSSNNIELNIVEIDD